MERHIELFKKIESIVKVKEHYLPRDYQTIGGMWTVDTYRKGDVFLQVMDEGWTTRIATKEIEMLDSGGNYTLKKGTIEEFESVLSAIQ